MKAQIAALSSKFEKIGPHISKEPEKQEDEME